MNHLKNFKSQFCASVSKYSSHVTSVAFLNCILVLLPLLYSVGPESQCVPILSAAISAATSASSNIKINEEFIVLAIYKRVTSVVEQFDDGFSASSRVDRNNRSKLI